MIKLANDYLPPWNQRRASGGAQGANPFEQIFTGNSRRKLQAPVGPTMTEITPEAS